MLIANSTRFILRHVRKKLTCSQTRLQASMLRQKGAIVKSPRVAIIADDLTGALDVCAPFARRGLRSRVAVSPSGLADALDRGGDVICVNTASRELDAEAASRIVRHVASELAGSRPGIVFKKIDSRLKGHVSAETGACQEVFRRPRVLVAPAIPAQGRFVQAGMIVGKGVAEPIDVADK